MLRFHANKQKMFISTKDRRQILSLYVTLFVLVYFLQPFFARVFYLERPILKYEGYFFIDYLIAYTFVTVSFLVFFLGLYIGTMGKPTLIKLSKYLKFNKEKKTKYFKFKIILITGLACYLSYFMLINKAGITIYREGAGLPYRLEGITHYTRIFIIPIVFIYLLKINTNLSFLDKTLITVCVAVVALVSSGTSGSRLIALVYTAIFYFIYQRKITLTIVISCFLIINILAASYARIFLIPFYLGDEYIQKYVSYDQHRNISEKSYFYYFFSYVIYRMMGIYEAMLVLNYAFDEELGQSILGTISYIQPFYNFGTWGSVNAVYGTRTGINVDFISSLFVKVNGFMGLHLLLILFSGYISGRSNRNYHFLFEMLGQKDLGKFILLINLIMFFENRTSILFLIYLTSVGSLALLNFLYFFKQPSRKINIANKNYVS